jgi:hypothetical protein
VSFETFPLAVLRSASTDELKMSRSGAPMRLGSVGAAPRTGHRESRERPSRRGGRCAHRRPTCGVGAPLRSCCWGPSAGARRSSRAAVAADLARPPTANRGLDTERSRADLRHRGRRQAPDSSAPACPSAPGGRLGAFAAVVGARQAHRLIILLPRAAQRPYHTSRRSHVLRPELLRRRRTRRESGQEGEVVVVTAFSARGEVASVGRRVHRTRWP